MNERISDLYEQACDIERENEIATKPYKDRVVIKFAELIVTECANEILKWKSEPFPFDPEFAAKLVKEHFGIVDHGKQ